MERRNGTPSDTVKDWESRGWLVPGCGGCAEFYDAAFRGKDPRDVFAPSHIASRRCESGRRPHCTCDTCF